MSDSRNSRHTQAGRRSSLLVGRLSINLTTHNMTPVGSSRSSADIYRVPGAATRSADNEVATAVRGARSELYPLSPDAIESAHGWRTLKAFIFCPSSYRLTTHSTESA